MEMQFESLLEKVTDFLKTEAKTETVVGEQFELGEFKCVPVMKIGMGFGTGGGEGSQPKTGSGIGGGAGAGMGMQPIGFLVTKGDEISFLAAGKTKGLAAAFERVPDLIEKIIDKQNAEKETA